MIPQHCPCVLRYSCWGCGCVVWPEYIPTKCLRLHNRFNKVKESIYVCDKCPKLGCDSMTDSFMRRENGTYTPYRPCGTL